jgi:zinc transport system substrate-binding protein
MIATGKLGQAQCMRALVAFATFLLMAMQGHTAPAEGNRRLSVLCTFAPMFSFTKNVTGDLADVEVLLGPAAEPHDMALSPKDLARLARADLVVMNGADFEAAVARALSGKADRLVDCSRDVPVNGNPHLWLDPVLAMKQTETIAAALEKADPANAATYQKNADRFVEELKKLDADAAALLAPLKGRSVIASHDAFGHFARRYGIEIAGVLHQHANDASTPKRLAMLKRLVEEKKVAFCWAHPEDSRREIDGAADFLGVKVVMLDPMEQGQATADFYVERMRQNLAALGKAIHGR